MAVDMKKPLVKFGIFVIGVFLLIPLGLLFLGIFSETIASFQQGADPASIFNGNELVLPEMDQARWIADVGDVGRNPSISQREEMISAYWLAWEALMRSYQTGLTSNLVTYWAGSAYENALKSVEDNPKRRLETNNHQLSLEFFSDDGTIALFTAYNLEWIQTLSNTTYNLSANASIMMTLDNGYWRIRTIVIHFQ